MRIEYLFFISIFLIVYTYFIYPIFLILILHFRGNKTKNIACTTNCEKSVSILFSAYNEEKRIEEKLKNFLTLDYRDVELIIGSDGSTDKTNGIVKEYANEQIKLFIFKKREGKANTLNKLVSDANGEILVFTDANTIFDRNALGELVKHFEDEKVGCVSGELILEAPNENPGATGETFYWKYERYIKKNEGRLGALIGANGGIYAIKRELFKIFPSDKVIMEDLLLSLRILRKRFKVIYEPKAIGYEKSSRSMKDEFIRKVRIIAGDLNAVYHVKNLLLPHYGLIAFNLWSHKIIRWSVPFLLIVTLSSNILLLDRYFYKLTFMFQLLIFLFIILGFILDRLNKKNKFLTIFYYFGSMNLAILVGVYRWLTNTQKVAWERVEH